MYVLSTGCQWRAIRKGLPPKSTEYGYFDLWTYDGTLQRIHHALYEQCGGLPAFFGTLIEALVLAVIGGSIGALTTFVIFDGFTASTLGASFTQVVFRFEFSPSLIAQGVVLALAVGLLGGLFPAIRAARTPIVAGLYG